MRLVQRRRRLRDMTIVDRRKVLTCLAGAGAAATLPSLAYAAPDPLREVPEAKFINAGVLEIAYLESGPSDGHPVVLLHGFPYDARAFDEVARRLAEKNRRVIVPYLRGYGPTRFLDAATPRVGQQAALGTDLLAFLDALAIPSATLAGFDWGGRAACVVAALYPERVRGLISSGGPGYNIQNLTEFLKSRPAKWERDHWFYYYMNSQRGMGAFSSDPAGFCRYLWSNFSPTWRFDDASFEQTSASFNNPDFVTVALHSYRYRIGEVAGDPALELLERRLAAAPAIRAPTIVLQGADEGVDPPEPAETIRPHFTNLRRIGVLAGVGHNAPQEAPERFADAVLEVDA
jgi:pimeloyl-ACP methyl ester carboxylesterase